jgi:hypothetical protein
MRSDEAKMMCPRCRRWVSVDRPWPHWAKARGVYFGLLGVALMGGPVILADAFVMIPMLMIYMAAIGPLNHLARQRPVCLRCGGLVTA